MEEEDMEEEAMEGEDMEEEAMVVMEEEAMVVEHTIPREAKEADIIPPMLIILTPAPMLPYPNPNILAIARKNANECGNIVVVLFHTSFVKEASFLDRMNYLHGKSIHAQ